MIKTTDDVKRYYGKISFPQTGKVQEGVWLNISNSKIFIESPASNFAGQNWEILHGSFNGIDKVTFVDCYSSGAGMGAGGFNWRIFPSYIIKNAHFKSLNELNFNKIILTSPALTKWMKVQEGIDTKDQINYKIPQRTELFISQTKDFQLTFNTGFTGYISYDEMNISRNNSIHCLSEKSVNITKMLEFIRHLKKAVLFLSAPQFFEPFKISEKSLILNKPI